MRDPAQRIPSDADAPVETLYEGKWLSLRKRGRWEYAERNNPGGAVIILAVTPQDKVLFVEQYRVAILQKTIEMIACAAKLREHAEQARLYRRLTRIALDAPGASQVDMLQRRRPDPDLLDTLCEQLGFGAFTRSRLRALLP